jgi:hypothetical protein
MKQGVRQMSEMELSLASSHMHGPAGLARLEFRRVAPSHRGHLDVIVKVPSFRVRLQPTYLARRMRVGSMGGFGGTTGKKLLRSTEMQGK